MSIYDDHPRDMTYGRRLALYLSRYGWYNSALNLEIVDRFTFGDDTTDVVSVSPPNLDVAWEFFEHQMLPRRIAKTEDSIKKEGNNLSYRRVEPGEQEDVSKLYPIWNTPFTDLGDFGHGVGRSFLSFHCTENAKLKKDWNLNIFFM